MTTTTFTTRLNAKLKKRLEDVARRDRRSASFMANLAIENLVEERDALRDLVTVGRELARRDIAMSEDAVDAWLRNPEDVPLPPAKKSTTRQ